MPSHLIQCVFSFPHQVILHQSRTLPLVGHVILSWVESFLYASDRGCWARLVTTHRQTWRREARYNKRFSRNLSFDDSLVLVCLRIIRLEHLSRTSWTRALWICFRAYPVLGSWRALLCGEEGFNDWGGRGHDDFVPSEVTKEPLPGMRLHDPLHGRQACPKFIAFDQGVGQICPRSRGYFRAVPSQNGNKYVTSPPPPIVELVGGSYYSWMKLQRVILEDR